MAGRSGFKGRHRKRRWAPEFGIGLGLLLGLLLACAPAASRTNVTDLREPSGADGAATEALTEARATSVRNDDILDVLTFNAALLPETVASTRPFARAAFMAPHLAGYDVLVLQEVFINSLRERLLDELTDAYPYRSDLVGVDGAGGLPWRQDGGIIILSRWPIVRQATMTFGGTCSGTDCLADKGVAYAAVRKGRFTYHVFGTHAQSIFGFDVASVRAAQFVLWRSFIEELAIPKDEPVLLTGDLNVDAYTPELHDMLLALGGVRPLSYGPLRYTWDYRNNAIAGGPHNQWLDYVLIAADYAQPWAAWNRVVPLREGDLELSDHYAVWGRIVMGRR